MVTDGSYAYREHSITHRVVESLCCIPETNVTLYVNYTQVKKKKENLPTFEMPITMLFNS